jgi:dicarboxylate transporter 10
MFLNRYTSAKRQLLMTTWLDLKEGIPLHILASLAAGTVATTVCAPADVLKSRLQSAAAANGKSQV